MSDSYYMRRITISLENHIEACEYARSALNMTIKLAENEMLTIIMIHLVNIHSYDRLCA